MQKRICGPAYVVGDDIDTDQMIPAQYLTYNPADASERKYFGKYAMSGLPTAAQGLPQGGIPFVKEGLFKSDYRVVIAGRNFGCGSSREHASVCLQEAGIEAVCAEFYSRIFFRNSVNGGYLIPFESQERLADKIRTGDVVEIDVEKNTIVDKTQGRTFMLKPLGDVLPILEAGNVFEYARRAGFIK